MSWVCKVVKAITARLSPLAISFTSINDDMCVANSGDDIVSVIDTSTNKDIETILVGNPTE